MNTSHIDTYLPGLVKKFGANQPVEINFMTTKAPTSYFQPGKLGADVSGRITVTSQGQLACIIDVISL